MYRAPHHRSEPSLGSHYLHHIPFIDGRILSGLIFIAKMIDLDLVFLFIVFIKLVNFDLYFKRHLTGLDYYFSFLVSTLIEE